jgi:hypothetical protein
MAGLGINAGFFLGGLGSGFVNSYNQSAELKLRRDAQQAQRTRELRERADRDIKQAWDFIEKNVTVGQASGATPEQIRKSVAPFIGPLQKHYQMSGRDPALLTGMLANLFNRPNPYQYLGNGSPERQQAAQAQSAFDENPLGYEHGEQPDAAPRGGGVPFVNAVEGASGASGQPSAAPGGFNQPVQRQPIQQPAQVDTAGFSKEFNRISKALAIAEATGSKGAYDIAKMQMQHLMNQHNEHAKIIELPGEDGGKRVFALDEKNRDANGQPRLMELEIPSAKAAPGSESPVKLDLDDPGDLYLKNNVPPKFWATIKTIHAGLEKPGTAIRSRGAKHDVVMGYLNDYAYAKGEPYDENQYYNNKIKALAVSGSDSKSLANIVKSRDITQTFMNGAIKIGRDLDKLGEAIDATGIPAVERWQRWMRKEYGGDPQVSAFNARLLTWRTEVARAIMGNPTLAGQLTDSSRNEIQHIADDASAVPQIIAVRKTVESEFGQRITAFNDGINLVRKRLGQPPEEGEPVPGESTSGDVSIGTPAVSAPGASSAPPAAGLSSGGGWTVKRITPQ